MADLLDSAPADSAATPVTSGDGVQPAAAPPAAADDIDGKPDDQAAAPAKPARKPVDIDATIEEALTATRKAADDRKAADATMKAAKELEAKYAAFAKLPPEQLEAYGKLSPERLQRYLAIEEHLTKSERVAAVRTLLSEQVDDDLVYDLAEHAKPKAAPTVDEAVQKALAERDKAASDKKAEEEKKTADEQAKSDQAEVDTWMKRSAGVLRAEVENYPWIKAWGCDATRYQQLTTAFIEKNQAVPEPAQILQLMEDEHIARHKKSPGAAAEPPPLDELEVLDDKVSATYERHRPPGPRITADNQVLSPADQARAELEAWDRQQSQRLRWTGR